MIPSFFYRDPGSFDWDEPWHGAHCGCPRCFVEHERRHSYDSRRTELARRTWAKQDREPRRLPMSESRDPDDRVEQSESRWTRRGRGARRPLVPSEFGESDSGE